MAWPPSSPSGDVPPSASSMTGSYLVSDEPRGTGVIQLWGSSLPWAVRTAPGTNGVEQGETTRTAESRSRASRVWVSGFVLSLLALCSFVGFRGGDDDLILSCCPPQLSRLPSDLALTLKRYQHGKTGVGQAVSANSIGRCRWLLRELRRARLLVFSYCVCLLDSSSISTHE